MTGIVGDVRLIDLVHAVIALTLLEGALIALHHRRSGKGVAPREFGANLLSGLCLMLALRSAVLAAHGAWVALFLLAAGVAHACDLWRRWQR